MNRLVFALVIALPLLAQSPKPTVPNSAKNVGMEFVKIAPGEFMMGCSMGDAQCDADEKPSHSVQITKSFEIGKYEVTQAQWMAVMGTNPSAHQGPTLPVDTVSKEDAQAFLDKLNAQRGSYHYRLPTEAEWEYAARAGAPLPASLDDVAWYAGNSGDQSHPVGQKKPNAWGIYDMLGNVREWVSDLYVMNYYANSPGVDPTGPQLGQGGQFQGGFGRGRRFNGPPPGGPGGQPNNAPNGAPNGAPPPNGPPPNSVPPPNYVPIAYQQDGGPQGGQQGQQGGGPGQGFGRGNFGGFNRGGGGRRQLPIMRGGAWDNPANFVRVSARYHYYGPTLALSDIGFRAVREPAQQNGGN